MHDRIHACFGHYSPFVADLVKTDRTTNISSDSVSLLDQTEINIDITKKEKRSKAISRAGFPTILQQTNSVAMRLTRLPVDDRTSEARDDIVLIKLTEARCIHDARELGLSQEFTDLRRFDGVDNVAKELCRTLGRDRLLDDLVPFCGKYDVDFNQVLADNIGQLCRGKDVTETTIMEACSLVYLCLTVADKCNAALVVLRAARVFGTPNSEIFLLADQSTQWAAADQSMKEELFEARRLLQIDAIIIKYCGAAARNMFQIENPRHSLRLFQFVCDHGGRQEGVIDDALSMCHAFNHLSETDAATKILESALLRRRPELCAALFEELVKHGRRLAATALLRTILAVEVVANQNHDATDYVEVFYNCIASLVMTAREKGLTLDAEVAACVYSLFEKADLREMRERLADIVTLRLSHSIKSTLQTLRNESEIAHLVKQKISEFADESGQFLEQDLKASKQLCNLLCSRKCVATDFWFASIAVMVKDRLPNPQSTKALFFVLKSSGMLTPRKPNAVHNFCQSVVAFGLVKSAISNSFSSENTIERAMQSLAMVADYSLRQVALDCITVTSTFSDSLEILKQAMEKSDGSYAELLGVFLSKYRWGRQKTLSQSIDGDNHRPRLHGSWYVGDGLLLPPEETLQCALEFLAGRWKRSKGSTELATLLASKGTHSFELHILCQAASMLSHNATSREEARLALIQDQLVDSVKAIAERSLGGTGYGITSSLIDSQNALSCLLGMDVKDAFSIFKMCIPMAIKRQSFSRLHMLANIGRMASADASRYPNTRISMVPGISWPNQKKFNEQCVTLSEKSTWWNVLSENGIDFDSKLFDCVNRSTQQDSEDQTYAESMLLLLISRLFSFNLGHSLVLEVCTRYAKSFRLQHFAPAACMVENLLGPVSAEEVPCTNKCKIYDVKLLLAQIQEPKAVLSVLRRCLRKLESSEKSGRDYELVGVALDLYYEHLCLLLDHDESEIPSSMVQLYQNEKKLVERRLSALSVLSSFYRGNRKHERPSFRGFFEPLPDRIQDSHLQRSDASRVVHLESASNVFDPLSSISPSLADLDSSSVMALAALCSPLGLPAGFLHARWLMKQFKIAVRSNANLPSFHEIVQPILNRLPLPLRTELADWCFTNYTKTNNNEKLRSFEAVLACKVQAATTAEEISNLTGERDIDTEHTSMEQIEHMTSLKNTLTHVLTVKEALLAHEAKAGKAIKQLCFALACSLDEEISEKPNMSIDDILDFVLRRGSELAAASCLSTSGFTLQQFRAFSHKVHGCCREISESHDERAKDLVQHWLFHGDENRFQENQTKPQLSPLQRHEKAHVDSARDDFVMDISEIQDVVDEWKAVDDPGNADKIIADEESSSIEPCSIREKSEFLDQRASLRIAFVMAFTEGPSDRDNRSKENLNSQNPTIPRMQTYLADKPGGDDDQCEIHGKFLMGIVFAKARPSASSRSTPKDIRTVTFAMRHRALRVASILCPHDILREISPTSSLRNICFGVFVAKEVEEMGLTLPHSDLVQLSSMSFATYARTLWMQHRKDHLKSHGRFLLLLCEMILKDSTSSDTTLHSVFKEIVRLRLPRTLLLALDRVSRVASSSCFSFHQGIVDNEICICLSNTADELSLFTHESYNDHRNNVISTFKLLKSILKLVRDEKSRQDYIEQLVDAIESSGGGFDSLLSDLGRKWSAT